MGCVYEALVTSAIKSMIRDLLISFSVNLKPEKMYQGLEVTQETAPFKLQETPFCSGSLTILCAQLQLSSCQATISVS